MGERERGESGRERERESKRRREIQQSREILKAYREKRKWLSRIHVIALFDQASVIWKSFSFLSACGLPSVASLA